MDIKKGQRVTVPSGMGGVWDCYVEDVRPCGKVRLRISNPAHPDWHGKILIRDMSEVSHG